MEDFGFRERFFRGVNAGVSGGFGLCGIDGVIQIIFHLVCFLK
jgi:hypothetical protein